jgi:hypothetical protein
MMGDAQRSSRLVWLALSWSSVALMQADRVLSGFNVYRSTMLAFAEPGICRLTPDSQVAKFRFWGDVQFFFGAVYHLRKVLMMIPSGPLLPEPTGQQAAALRHLLEHWWDSARDGGAWKGLRQQHGDFATPTSVLSDFSDLKIVEDRVSVVELKHAIEDIHAELVQVASHSYHDKSNPTAD